MPGDDWQKFGNLRLLFGYMFGQPGKKLIFMEGEIGEWDEWYHERSIAWRLLDNPATRGLKTGSVTSTECIAANPRCINAISAPKDLSGSTSVTRKQA